MDDKRHFKRLPFNSQAKLTSGDTVWQTRAMDISLRGVLLARPPGWSGQTGQPQRLAISLAGPCTISMDVTVAHVDQHRVGCRCDRIDLDSFAHLKHVVMARLGCESELTEQLNALG